MLVGKGRFLPDVAQQKALAIGRGDAACAEIANLPMPGIVTRFQSALCGARACQEKIVLLSGGKDYGVFEKIL